MNESIKAQFLTHRVHDDLLRLRRIPYRCWIAERRWDRTVGMDRKLQNTITDFHSRLSCTFATYNRV